MRLVDLAVAVAQLVSDKLSIIYSTLYNPNYRYTRRQYNNYY